MNMGARGRSLALAIGWRRYVRRSLLFLERHQHRSQAHALHHASLAIPVKPGALTILCGHDSSEP
jgi:hypothetical protein